MKKLAIILFITFSSLLFWGQNNKTGQILSAKDSAEIVDANIYFIKNEEYSNTNYKGNFNLKYTNDSIIVTHYLYKTLKAAIDDSNNVFYLEPNNKFVLIEGVVYSDFLKKKNKISKKYIESTETVPGATVTIQKTGIVTITDIDGKFTLKVNSSFFSDSTYPVLQVNYIGKEDYITTIKNTSVNLTIHLEDDIVICWTPICYTTFSMYGISDLNNAPFGINLNLKYIESYDVFLNHSHKRINLRDVYFEGLTDFKKNFSYKLNIRISPLGYSFERIYYKNIRANLSKHSIYLTQSKILNYRFYNTITYSYVQNFVSNNNFSVLSCDMSSIYRTKINKLPYLKINSGISYYQKNFSYKIGASVNFKRIELGINYDTFLNYNLTTFYLGFRNNSTKIPTINF